MDTGALVNEAYLRLLNTNSLTAADQGYFRPYAAQAMRSVVVDVVCEHRAERQGGGKQSFVTMDTGMLNATQLQGEDEILRVHEALQELEQVDEPWCAWSKCATSSA